MSLTRTLTTGVRSATYNPEAEKAAAEDRKKAMEAREIITQVLDNTETNVNRQAQEMNLPQGTVDKFMKVIETQRKFLIDNPDLTSEEYTEKGKQFQKEIGDAFMKLFTIGAWVNAIEYMGLKLQEAEANKLYKREDQNALQALYEEADSFLKKADSKTIAEIIKFTDQWTKKYIPLEQKTKFDLKGATPQVIAELRARLETKKAVEDKKFNFKRFLGRIGATASTVVNSLLYITFALVIAMLAANDAVGREPMYRVLYFFYALIFAPLVGIYYLYRWFKGTAPKIYTLLPYSHVRAETTIGRFFKFPFYWQEDKPARDLVVAFMTASAEAVGKTFDPKSLGSLGQQVETVAENLKNLTEAGVKAAEGAAEAVTQTLPNVSKLAINK